MGAVPKTFRRVAVSARCAESAACANVSGTVPITIGVVRSAPARLLGLLAGVAVATGLAAPDVMARADRAVAWLPVDGAFERDLNRAAARGLRLAAISDGLPCGIAVLQAPDPTAPAASYRVLADRDLAGMSALLDDGFVPRAATRIVGARHAVVFERTTPLRPRGEWIVVSFPTLEVLGAAMSGVASNGFRAKLLVRPPFRSWVGLSEPGIVLAARQQGDTRVESRVLVGTNRDLNDMAVPLKAATAEGWGLDLLFSSARDGSERMRRERLIVVLSRMPGTTSDAAVSIERHTAFGLFGAGRLAGAAAFWDDYLTAWTPRERHQIWASPLQLSNAEASCAGLGFKLRMDGMDEQAHDIVAVLGKPRPTGGHELVVVTEQRLGF
jgi:hypothetical protein